jgi:uncharacterized protein (TIGR02145 family)
MDSQEWTDPNWQQTWSGASSYVPVNCELSNNFVSGAPARYSSSDLQAGSGYLYNYACVNKEQHNLCPAPWRVPTLQDFIDLDRFFGGTGEIRTSTTYQTFITEHYINAWGGVYGGYRDATSIRHKGDYMALWSAVGGPSSAYTLCVYYTAGTIDPMNYATQRFGMQVRCVR